MYVNSSLRNNDPIVRKIMGIFVAGLIVPSNSPLLLQRMYCEFALFMADISPAFQSSSLASATVSPYVIAMKCVSIRGRYIRCICYLTPHLLGLVLPQVVNAGLITSAFSAGNSFLFAASRILFGLAVREQAPAFFLKTKNGVPIVAVLFTVRFVFLNRIRINSSVTIGFIWFTLLDGHVTASSRSVPVGIPKNTCSEVTTFIPILDGS